MAYRDQQELIRSVIKFLRRRAQRALATTHSMWRILRCGGGQRRRASCRRKLRRDARSWGSEHPGQRQARHAPGTWARPSGTACAGGSVLGCGGGEEKNFYAASPSGRRSPRLIARTSLQRQCLPYGDIHFPLTAALVLSSRHRSRLTFDGLLFFLTCVRSRGRYAWSPLPAARLSESAGSRVGALD